MKWLVGLRRAGTTCLLLPRWSWWLVALLWTGFIWWLSSHTGAKGDGKLLWAWASNLAHAPLFGVFALCLALSLPRVEAAFAGRRRWVRLAQLECGLVLLLTVAAGVIDELHQAGVPGRDASVFDVLTDGTAAVCVLGVAYFAGMRDAKEGGVRLRLLAGVVACLAVALLATLASG